MPNFFNLVGIKPIPGANPGEVTETILINDEHVQNDSNAQYQDRLGPFNLDTMLTITAFGQAKYSGDGTQTADAGITVTTSVMIGDGEKELLAADMAFSTKVYNVTFSASVSAFKVIPKETVIVVYSERQDIETNSDFLLRTFYSIQPIDNFQHTDLKRRFPEYAARLAE